MPGRGLSSLSAVRRRKVSPPAGGLMVSCLWRRWPRGLSVGHAPTDVRKIRWPRCSPSVPFPVGIVRQCLFRLSSHRRQVVSAGLQCCGGAWISLRRFRRGMPQGSRSPRCRLPQSRADGHYSLRLYFRVSEAALSSEIV